MSGTERGTRIADYFGLTTGVPQRGSRALALQF
jgi:hypothetical protein